MSRMLLKASLRDLNLSPNLNRLATNLCTHHTYNTEETCRAYLQYHYRLSNNNYIRHPFKAKSDFTPPLPDNANFLEYMSRILLELKTSHGQNIDNKTTRLDNNVSNAEKQAIKNLRNSEQVIVKPADKGGAIVIWPRESYIAEANKQLNDKRKYETTNLSKRTHSHNWLLN